MIQVTDVLKPLNDRGFPSGPGVAAAAAIVTAAAPWVARRWRRAGWTLVIGLALTRFLSGPISFDALRGVAHRLGRRRRGAGAVRRTVAPADQRVDRGRARCRRRAARPSGTRERRRARLDAVLRGGDRRPQAVRESARRGPAQRRHPVPPVPLRDAPAARRRTTVLVVAPHGRARGVRRARGRRRGRAHAARSSRSATADPNAFVLAYEAIDGKSLDGVAPEDLTDAVLEAIWGQVSRAARPPDRAPRPAPGERLPRGRRRRRGPSTSGSASSRPPTCCSRTTWPSSRLPSRR